jgi:hypothetical protein
MNGIQPNDVPKFPRLESGVTLLSGSGRVTGALQSLVLDHVLLSEGEVFWVDAEGNASTTGLARIAPSRRILDRIRVARAFTAFQHYSLIETLEERVTAETPLVVVPSVEWFYANDDLRTGEAETMLEHALGSLQDIASTTDTPVLVSSRGAGDLGSIVEAESDSKLECIQTEFGPRFSGEEFETLVFECNGGVQTTLAFWRRVLEQRHPVQATGESTEVVSVGTY